MKSNQLVERFSVKSSSRLAIAVAIAFCGFANAELPKGLKNMDRDGDGKLSVEEFSNDQLGVLKKIDSNKDKVLSADEVRSYYLKDAADPKAQRRVGHILSADTDGDGKVTADELKAKGAQEFQKRDKNADGFVTEAD